MSANYYLQTTKSKLTLLGILLLSIGTTLSASTTYSTSSSFFQKIYDSMDEQKENSLPYNGDSLENDKKTKNSTRSSSSSFSKRAIEKAAAVIFAEFANAGFTIAMTDALSKSVSVTLADPEEVFLYTLNFNCPSTTAGDCDNVIITDTISSNIEFINFPAGCTSCNYDASTGIFTANLGTINNGSTISLDLQVRFPSNVITGVTAENTAIAEYDQNSITEISISETVTTTATNGIVITYDNMGYISKPDVTGSSVSLAGFFTIDYGHSFNSTVTNYVFEDVFPNGMIFDGMFLITTGCSPAVPYNVEYLVYNTTSSTESWVASTTNPQTSDGSVACANQATSCTQGGYALNADEYIKGLRLSYPNAPGDGCFHQDTPTNSPRLNLYYKFDETITGVTNPIPGDIINNCATVTADQFSSVQDCGAITIPEPRHRPYSFKADETNTGPYEPGEIVTFRIGSGNITGSGDYDVVNPTMVDLLPPELEYIGNLVVTPTNIVNQNAGSSSFDPVVTTIPDFMGVIGQTAIYFSWHDGLGNGITIPYGGLNYMLLNFDVRVRSSAPDMSTLTNSLYVYDDREPDGCITDVNDIDLDGDTTDDICVVSADINILYPPGFAGLDSYKEVQGNLDTDFSRFPASGLVDANGNIEYKLCIENPANLPETVDDIIIVDVLPHVGDRGVVANDELRETAWRPVFTATTLSNLQTYVAGISGATLYLSTVCEPCLNADLGPAVTDLGTCSPPNWSSSPPATLSDVCAFKIDYGTTFELTPGSQTCLNMNMTAPSNVPTDGSIAWNSFGYVGNKENGSILFASEPIKVGIASIVSDKPTADAGTDVSICNGANTTLSGAGGGSYAWSPSTGLSADNIANPVANPIVTTTYTLTVTDGNSCTDTDMVTVTVNPIPSATAASSPPTCAMGSSSANSDGMITLSGFNTGERFDYNTGSSYSGSATFAAGSTTIPANGIIANNLANPTGSQQYTIRVFNSNECFTDLTVVLNEITCITIDYPDYSKTGNSCTDEPCHIISSDLFLGSEVTPDATPSGTENADTDADDGISILSTMQFTAGSTVRIPVEIYNNTGTNAHLRMWIDWNGDGDFDDSSEQIENNTYPDMGTIINQVHISVTIPMTAIQDQAIALRARLSTDDANSSTPCGTGTCAADGEIEDYLLQVTCPKPICTSSEIRVDD